MKNQSVKSAQKLPSQNRSQGGGARNTQGQNEEEEFEEEYEEEYEEDAEGDMSQAARTKRSQLNKDNKTDAMRTINRDGKSIYDNNANTTFQGTQDKINTKTNLNQQICGLIIIRLNYQYKQNQQQQPSNKDRNSQGRRTRTHYNLDEENGEEYYDEEDGEEYDVDKNGTQMGHSRLSDSLIRTPDIGSEASYKNGGRPNIYNDYIKKNRGQSGNIGNKKSLPYPANNDDYFKNIKNRKTGIPMSTKLPRKIEAHQINSDLPPTDDPFFGTQVSLSVYKEVIPSFLPNENKYQKFGKNLNQDEVDIYNRLKNKYNTANDDDGLYVKRKKQFGQSDPFEQHMQKIEDKHLKTRGDSAQPSPNDSLYKVHNIGGAGGRTNNGFLSVQRQRNPIKFSDEKDLHNISLPQIRDQIGTMEKKMEKELDKEAKLKKDAKRLIGHALGKNIPELDRTVKAWLKKDQTPGTNTYYNILAYINEMGPVYTLEYRKLIEKEVGKNGGISPIIDKQMRKGLFNKGQEQGQNNFLAIKEKLKNENQQRIDKQKQMFEGPQYVFNYDEIKQVYNVSLLDQHFGSPEAYLLKKKDDAKQTISHVFKRKFEEKLIFQQLNDPKTLRKDRVKLEEKLKMIGITVELAKQRLEWLIYDTPFTIQQLEHEVSEQKQGIQQNSEEQEKLKKIAQTFKMDKQLYEEMQRKTIKARNILNLQILEARALKNRTGCESISDFVLLYREFVHIERLPDMLVLLNDALLNKKKSQDFFDFISKIVQFEDETIKVRDEFADNKIEKSRIDHDQFYNYDEIALEKAKLQGKDKDQFVNQFKQEKLIFQFIPFWHVQLSKDGDQLSAQLRQMLSFDIVQAKIICQFLTCNTLEEMITYARHNRKVKEYIIFEKEEIQYLIREHKIPEKILKDFAQLMIIIQKEYLMVPQILFKLARPTSIQEINFSNFSGNHLTQDALASIIACVEIHQKKVKRLIFQNCELDAEKAKSFRVILSNENKPIIHCNFDNNRLGDQGLDHIVQAIKNNPKGDMRILKISENKLNIQAAIRVSHVLKKRPSNIQPLNIQILKMSNNEIGNIGTETLASFIKKNGTLKYLDLSFNLIGDRGLFALADCLHENNKMEVLSLLGNDFSGKSLGNLGTALVENEQLKLIILKLGVLNCDKQSFLNFINNGFMISKKIKFIYMNTPHFSDPIVQSLNQSYLPKVYYATEAYDPKIDSYVLLDFMCQIVEFQLFEGGNTQRVYKFGEKLLREIIKQKYELNNIEILIYLFENIFGPDYILQDNLSPFHLFAKHGQIEAMQYCLKLGISPNFKTSIAYEEYPSATALHIGAGYSQLDTCEHLLKYGVEVDNKDLNGNTALHYAAVQGALHLAQLLVSNGASLIVNNKKNMLPLHSCIFSDNLACWRFILGETEKQKQIQYYGKQIEKTLDIKTYQGFTPLMIALEENSDNIFQYLIENGADLKAQDEEGNTVLHRAILLKDEKKAKVVIKKGANIHIRSFAGETPIMMAVRNGLIDVIRLLVNQGADIHEKNYRGDSLLHLAARIDQADVIGFLLDKGLSTLDKNREGQRPCDLALRPAIKQLLSYSNQQHNIYREPNTLQKKQPGERLKANANQSEASDDEYYQETAKSKQRDQRAKLLNEEIIKYKVDKKDLFGSNYDRQFGKYDAAKITRDKMGADIDETKGEDSKRQTKQLQNYANKDDDYDEAEEDEEGEEYEDDEEYEDQQLMSTQNKKTTKGLGQTRKSKTNNKQSQNKLKSPDRTQNQTAGFRGTVDASKNNTTRQLKLQAATSKNNHLNNQRINPKTNRTNDEEFYNVGEGEEGEYDDEEEEFEDEENDQNKTYKTQNRQSQNTKRGFQSKQ